MHYSESWKDMTRRYREHRQHAAARGLPFTLTMQQWSALWSPHWGRREADNLRMCRYLDMGGYTPGNVYIGSAADNFLDQVTVRTWHAYWHRWSARHSDGNCHKRTTLSHEIVRLQSTKSKLDARLLLA